MAKLSVGQKLWYVPTNRHGQPLEVIVAKVGRKWAYLDRPYGIRLSTETLRADGAGFSSPGQAHITREHWADETRLQTKWRDFKRAVDRSHGWPDGLPEAELDAFMAKLAPSP